MSKQIGFKTSFRGFSRNDVLTYIDQLRVTLQEEQDSHRREIEALTAQIDSLRQRESQLVAELEEARRASQEQPKAEVSPVVTQQPAEEEEAPTAEEVPPATQENSLKKQMEQWLF